MVDIEKYLIKSLIITPKNDQEIGFNSALITLLKGIASGIPLDAQEAEFRNNEVPETENRKNFTQLLRSIPFTLSNNANTILESISNNDLDDIINDITTRNKLAAVKHLKEVAGLGLKEAKDICDAYEQIILGR